MRSIINIVALIAFHGLYVSAQTTEWGLGIGGDGLDGGYSITADSDGNVYVTGNFQDSMDFNPSPFEEFIMVSEENWDAFVLKLDSSGAFEWVVTFGGGHSRGLAIELGADQSITAAGWFRHQVDFDPGVGTYYMTSGPLSATPPYWYWEYFIVRLNLQGELQWVRHIPGYPESQNPVTIDVDANGGVALAGTFNEPEDFDPGPGVAQLTPLGEQDIFVVLLDSMGNFIWVKQIAGEFDEVAKFIGFDESNDLLISGWFYDTVDFDPGVSTYELTATPTKSGFCMKLSENGELIWAEKTIPGSSFVSQSGALDSAGNLYIIGSFSDFQDFDPGPGVQNRSAGDGTYYVLKLDNNGKFVWVQQFSVFLDAIDVSDNQSVFLTAEFSGYADFQHSSGYQTVTGFGFSDFCVIELLPNGEVRWARSYGGPSYNESEAIFHAEGQGLFVTGHYVESIDFGLGLDSLASSGLSRNCFVMKLDLCDYPTSVVDQTVCNSLISPSGGTSWTESGIYYDTVPDFWGCDDITRFDLIVINPDESVTFSENLVTANAPNGIYQWLDCLDNLTPINGETSSEFSPTDNGNYALEITLNGCTDTSECFVLQTLIFSAETETILSVFPNPTDGNIIIDLGQIPQQIDVVINNELGQEVFRSHFIATKQIDLAIPGERGVYFIEITTDEEHAVLKVVKE